MRDVHVGAGVFLVLGRFAENRERGDACDAGEAQAEFDVGGRAGRLLQTMPLPVRGMGGARGSRMSIFSVAALPRLPSSSSKWADAISDRAYIGSRAGSA
jgi:hypothetical protein